MYAWDIPSLKQSRQLTRRNVNMNLLRQTIGGVKDLMRASDPDTKQELAKVGIILSSLMVK